MISLLYIYNDLKKNKAMVESGDRQQKKEPELEQKSQQGEICFFQGTTDLITTELASVKNDREKLLKAIKEKIREFFNIKHINFLFGSGTSCPAIPNMTDLYAKVVKRITRKGEPYASVFKKISKNKNKNLEEILGVLYSANAYDNGYGDGAEHWEICRNLILEIEKCIFKEINVDFTKTKSEKVLNTYKQFYQKLAFRNKDLSRLHIFTTNNDLMNERALDALNIHYINGFGGGISKYFNPALFNYTYSKRMDTSIDKFEPVENMVYLYKIHGSINWVEDESNGNSYFNIREENPPIKRSDRSVLIYPTPTKQNKSLGAPYVDLFREFQHCLLVPNSVLFVIGYSFSDEHVNDIIYRALATNTTINVFIINDLNPDDSKPPKAITQIGDNRIFNLWERVENSSSKERLHYFDSIVEKLLPNLDASKKQEDSLQEFIKALKSVKNTDENNISTAK